MFNFVIHFAFLVLSLPYNYLFEVFLCHQYNFQARFARLAGDEICLKVKIENSLTLHLILYEVLLYKTSIERPDISASFRDVFQFINIYLSLLKYAFSSFEVILAVCFVVNTISKGLEALAQWLLISD